MATVLPVARGAKICRIMTATEIEGFTSQVTSAHKTGNDAFSCMC